MRVRYLMHFRRNRKGTIGDLPYEEALDLADAGIVEIPDEELPAIEAEAAAGDDPVADAEANGWTHGGPSEPEPDETRVDHLEPPRTEPAEDEDDDEDEEVPDDGMRLRFFKTGDGEE